MERRRLLVASIAAALVIGVSGGILAARGGARSGIDRLTAAGADTLPDDGIPVATDGRGKAVPDLTAESMSGAPVALRALAGRPLVLNFWFSTCAPCRKEMPDFQSVHEALGDRVRIVGVNPQDSSERAAAFAAEVGATYELLRDPNGEITVGLGVVRFPTTVFVDDRGTVLETAPGELSSAELMAKIDELFPT